ncbi:hypothetical protein [Peribacillus simplex]|uniref:hypothetical protein n=1 Tax=Peribacillus simplex TaxID=1478 RepID=UPI003D2CDF20
MFLSSISRKKAEAVIIDFSHSKIWDASAARAKVALKYKLLGIPVQVQGLDEESSLLLEKLATSERKIS